MRAAVAMTILSLGLCLQAAPQTPTGVVRVNVRDPETSEPIPGVRVSLTTALDLPDSEADLLAYLNALAAARGVSPLNIVIGHSNNAPPASPAPPPRPDPVTDAAGNAVFSALAPGLYTVSVRREGYATSPVSSAKIQVEADKPSSVSLVLSRAASVAGRVTDADGNPLANVLILVTTFKIENGLRVAVQRLATATTDPLGQYRIVEIAAGDYLISASLPTPQQPRVFYYPNTIDLQRATDISIKGGQAIVGLDLVAPR